MNRVSAPAGLLEFHTDQPTHGSIKYSHCPVLSTKRLWNICGLSLILNAPRLCFPPLILLVFARLQECLWRILENRIPDISVPNGSRGGPDGWRDGWRRRLWILEPPAARVQHWCQDGSPGAFRFRGVPRSGQVGTPRVRNRLHRARLDSGFSTLEKRDIKASN